MNPNCPLYKNGRCGRDRRYKCKPSSIDWLREAESMTIIEVNQMCAHGSIFGNHYIGLDLEDLEALKEGKILYHIDEYGTFIGLIEDSKEATEDVSS